MTDVPSALPPEPSEADVAGYRRHVTAVSEATHRHLEKVVKPSLLAKPNSGGDLPDKLAEDDFPTTVYPAHAS